MAPQIESPDAIWAEDYLSRRSEADYLTRYLVRRFEAKPREDGFVLAINGDWGMGKTFLLKKWGENLTAQGYPYIYFDAWQNDYTPEPLIAFIAELDDGLKPYFKLIPNGPRAHRAFIATAKKVLKPAAIAVAYAVAKHSAGLSAEHASELLEQGTAALTSEEVTKGLASNVGKDLQQAVTAALKQHVSTKKAIQAFKEKLSFLVSALRKASSVQLPLFVFIDELDRCRPNYAIELLEGIKHLFGVPGIYFVVATNISQLSESTRAIYGPSFDGQRYLKRFFDLEYALPEPSQERFASELMRTAALPPDITYSTGELGRIIKLESDIIPSFLFELYAELFGLTLRDQQQVIKIFEACALAIHPDPIHIHFLLFLATLYHKSHPIYRHICARRNTADSRLSEILVSSRGILIPGKTDIWGERTAADRNVPLLHIVDIYFESLSRPIFPVHDINLYDFPKNLKHSIYDRNGNLTNVERYIGLVSRAGSFGA